MGIVYGGVVEWNVEHNYKGYSKQEGKYAELYNIFDKLKVCDGKDNSGWVKVSFENADDAKRAQTAISQYCGRKYAGSPWRHQTSVSVENGVVFLFLRKIKI